MNEEDTRKHIEGLELKVLAYKQDLAVKHEESVDFRVRLTMMNDKNIALQSKVDELEASLTELKAVDVQENPEATESN